MKLAVSHCHQILHLFKDLFFKTMHGPRLFFNPGLPFLSIAEQKLFCISLSVKVIQWEIPRQDGLGMIGKSKVSEQIGKKNELVPHTG